jgi:hypothetical protein
MPEIELQRAHELALAARDAKVLFWTIIIGMTLIIAFWSLVRRLDARRKTRSRRALLGAEARRQSEKDALLKRRADDAAWWQEFAVRNDLPESTRITLIASVSKNATAKPHATAKPQSARSQR